MPKCGLPFPKVAVNAVGIFETFRLMVKPFSSSFLIKRSDAKYSPKEVSGLS